MKVAGIPGVCQNLREKRGFLKGIMQKSGKFQGVMIKLTGDPGGQLQKNWYPQQEGKHVSIMILQPSEGYRLAFKDC